jgi:hypothetical protein
MMLSFAVDTASHAATMRFLEKPDVFNVSITRARVAQHVYLSIDKTQLRPDSLLHAYIHMAEQGAKNMIWILGPNITTNFLWKWSKTCMAVDSRPGPCTPPAASVWT